MGNICSSSSKKSKDIDQPSEGERNATRDVKSDAAAAEKNAKATPPSSSAPAKNDNATASTRQQAPTKALGQDMQITKDDLSAPSNVPSTTTAPESSGPTPAPSGPTSTTAARGATSETPANVVGTPAPTQDTASPTQVRGDAAAEPSGSQGTHAYGDAESEFYSAAEDGDDTILDGTIPSGFSV